MRYGPMGVVDIGVFMVCCECKLLMCKVVRLRSMGSAAGLVRSGGIELPFDTGQWVAYCYRPLCNRWKG